MAAQDTANTLNAITGDIQLAAVVEGVVVPIVIAAVKEIKAWVNESGQVEFTVALQQGSQDISEGVASFVSALTAINAERQKANLPPLPIPGQ